MREEILVEVKNELQMMNRVFWARFEERESEAKRECERREKELAEMFQKREGDLKQALVDLEKKFELREQELKEQFEVESLPYLAMCGYRDSLGHDDSGKFITYDRLMTNYTNGYHGSFDIRSGTFEARVAGAYTITYSGHAYFNTEGGEGRLSNVDLNLWLNGVEVDDFNVSTKKLQTF